MSSSSQGIKLYKVCVSSRAWQGGDYNGSWMGVFNEKLFSTKKKAQAYIDSYEVDWLSQTKFYGPEEIVID